MTGASPKPAVLVVDDTPINLEVATTILRPHYQALAATDGPSALALIARKPALSLVLLDVMMPGMDGYEVCRRIKADPALAHLPVIFLTSLNDSTSEELGFAAGGVDYIGKPFHPGTLLSRVGTHVRLHAHERALDTLVRERTATLEARTRELEETRLQVIRRLGRAAEYKDDNTGLHVIRVSHYTRLLAEAAGLAPKRVDILFHASPMHDIGKIGIPDSILKKSGDLTQEEVLIMRQHSAMGASIIGGDDNSELLDCARMVAQMHHEKWDGSGYPQGLSGTDIPLEARIVTIADVFDALTSERPYKKAWTPEDACAFIRRESGKHFDPGLVPLFFARLDEILEVRAHYSKAPDSSPDPFMASA